MGEGKKKLPFLTAKEMGELNLIGYSGKNAKKEKMTRTEFLNSLNKGTFSIVQVGFDSGDLCETFNIVRVTFPKK